MKIDSPRFGALEIAPDRIIEFPNGLPGFEQMHRFSVFHPEGEAQPNYHILQSLDDASVAFHIADPARLGFDYEIALSDEDAAILKLKDAADVAVAVMLIKDDAGGALRANVQAPLIMNTRSRLGLQHVFSKLNYEVKAA